MTELRLNGIYPAIVTPLTADGALASGVAEKLVTRLAAAEVDGIYAAGSTGEGMHLPVYLREQLVECLSASLPVDRKLIVHVGAADVRDAIRLAGHAARAGAHAVSSLPPAGDFVMVREYYRQLAASTELPLILYYFPEACPEAFRRPEEILEICRLPNVLAVKFTDYNLYLLSEIDRQGSLVFNGRDEILAAGLLMGAGGGIGSTYNLLPESYVAVYRHARRGEWEAARDLQFRINRVISVLLRYPFLAALKAALEREGLDCGPTLKGGAFASAGQKSAFLAELSAALSGIGDRAPTAHD